MHREPAHRPSQDVPKVRNGENEKEVPPTVAVVVTEKRAEEVKKVIILTNIHISLPRTIHCSVFLSADGSCQEHDRDRNCTIRNIVPMTKLLLVQLVGIETQDKTEEELSDG